MFVPIGGGVRVGYQTQRSLRLRASASAYLSRTFSGAGGNPWTWSGMVKRGTVGTRQFLFGANNGGNTGFGWDATDHFIFVSNGGADQISTSAFRDPTAAGHLLVTSDGSVVKAYWNNVLIANIAIAAAHMNTAIAHNFGRLASGSLYTDGLYSEFYFVDGKSLTPPTFCEYDADTPAYWRPKSPAQVRAGVAVGGGARNGFGTNGCYLPFSDPTSTTTLMYDRSQSDTDTTGNNWTANNVSLSAGVNYDSLLDVPLGSGGQERGVYCTLNPLIPSAANITNGNLSSGTTPARGTFDCSLFNSQWEVTAGASGVTAGVIDEAGTANTTSVTANKTFAFRLSTSGALDYKNITDAGSWTSITTGLSGTRFPYGTAQAASWNFGQRPLAEAVTAGYYTLNTGNLGNTGVVTGGSFTGNLSAGGPVVWCNGTPETLTINGNAVTWGTHADKLAVGFKIRTTSSSYNSSGTNTWAATFLSPSSKSAFKYQNAKASP